MTDYLRGQEEQRYFGGCCEHTAQVSTFCAAFLGMVYNAMERVEYFGGFFCFAIIHVVREMRSPNLFFFLDNKLSLQCIQILDAVSCPRPRPLPLPSPVCSMSDPAAPTTNMYPRGMNPRLRYIKSYWWPYKTFVKQRYASALSVPTAL